MQSQKSKYFDNLDGLRFILACIVFASHSMLGTSFNALIPFDFLKRLVTVFTSGHLGVSFFFVLSGFLITYLMLEENTETGSFSIKRFYVRRILRIWPLYLCVLVFSFFIYPVIKGHLGYPDQNPFNLIHQILFLSNFDSIRVHHLGLVPVAPLMISINWSIAIEEQFYLLWPLLFILFKDGKFWIVCLLIIVFCWIFRLLNQADGAILYYHSFSVASDMAVGGLGAWLCLHNKKFLEGIEKLSKSLIVLIYAIGFSTLMYSDLWFNAFINQTTVRILQTAFFCFIIMEQNFSNQSLFKLGAAKKISSMGKYTYGLYMLHPIGIQFTIIAFRYLDIQRDQNVYFSLLYVANSFVISIALAVLSYHLLERYFLEKRKLFY